jgi:hypothetical protein
VSRLRDIAVLTGRNLVHIASRSSSPT